MTDLVWFDDRLVPASSDGTSTGGHGFEVGDAVFETMKAVDGTPFALTRHLRRLASSATGLGLPAPDEARVREAVGAVLDRPGLPALVRVRVTYGGGDEPHLVVVATPATPWPATTDVVTVPWPRNERSAVGGLKTNAWVENLRIMGVAQRAGASEALLANTRGELCEGTGTNVFVVDDGVLLTPPLSSGCLAGVTRGLVLEWCGAREEPIPYDRLASFDEIFLTSSTRDVHPVATLDGVALPVVPGPVTLVVAEEFARRSSTEVDP